MKIVLESRILFLIRCDSKKSVYEKKSFLILNKRDLTMQIPGFTNHIATNFFLWAMLITAFVMAVYSYVEFHDRILPVLPSDSKKHFLVANSSEAEWTGKLKLSSDGKTLEHTVPIHINTTATNRLAQARGVSNAALGSLANTLEYYASEDISDNSGVQWRGLTAAGAGGQVLITETQSVNVVAFKSKKDRHAQVMLHGHVKFAPFTLAGQGDVNYILNLTNIPLPSTSQARGTLQLVDWSMDDSITGAGDEVASNYVCELVGGTMAFYATYTNTIDQSQSGNNKVTKDVVWDLTNSGNRASAISGVEFYFQITYRTDPDAVAVSTTVY